MTRMARVILPVGIVAVVLGLSKVHAGYIADPVYSFTGTSRFSWAIAYIVLLVLAAYGAGLPDLPHTVRSAVGGAVGASLAGALGISLVQLVVGDALLPRFVVFGSALLLIPWYLMCVVLASGGRVHATGRDQIVVVADPSEVATLEDDLLLGAEVPAHVVAVLSPDEASSGTHRGERPLIDAVRDRQATVVVLNRDSQTDQAIVDQVAILHESGVRVRTLSLFYEQWLGKLPLWELERVSLLFDISEVHRTRYGRTKRIVDVALGAIGMVVFIVMCPLVVIGDVLGNRGPLFYSQRRVGKNGEEFVILKFRTMRPTATDDVVSTDWTQDNDPRITTFGRLLRTTHIDEIPQVINIMRGDLSMVGPRPEQPHYVAQLREKLPFYDLRHLVRPGVTGWAQVKYGYAGDESDAMEKLQFEFYYLRHQRLSFDARILIRTIRSVLRREGR